MQKGFGGRGYVNDGGKGRGARSVKSFIFKLNYNNNLKIN